MKLNAFDRILSMAQAHHHAFGRLRADLEAGRHVRHHQRMVSSRGETLRQAFEDGLRIVKDRTRLAMHERGSSNDLSTEDFTDGLVAKADSEDRDALMETLDHVFGNAGIVRSARARRNDNVRRLERLDLIESYAIVAEHAQLVSHLTQVLHKVVGEGIVVINHDDHSSKPRCASW